jgi:hypothetical protein
MRTAQTRVTEPHQLESVIQQATVRRVSKLNALIKKNAEEYAAFSAKDKAGQKPEDIVKQMLDMLLRHRIEEDKAHCQSFIDLCELHHIGFYYAPKGEKIEFTKITSVATLEKYVDELKDEISE